MYKLDDVCKEYLLEMGDTQLNKYARVNAIATSGLRELSMDFSATIQSKELPLTSIDTVDLPAGFLNYTAISLVGADGILYGLGKNNNIDTTQYFTDCGEPKRYNSNINRTLEGSFYGFIGDNIYLAEHYRNGQNFGAYFNAGGHNTVGQYRIDYNANRILLSGLGVYATSVILEYICDIDAQDGDYMVHPYIINALKTWIDWKMGKADYVMFKIAKSQAIHRYKSETLQEWIDAIRKSYKGTIKY